MRAGAIIRWAVATAAWTVPAWAQVPAGGGFRANTYTTAAQYGRAVALNAQGNFVVAWHSDGQDGSGYGVFAQRFDATGAPKGAEFRVSVATSGSQWFPSVANDGGNGFVIAFMSPDGDGAG